MLLVLCTIVPARSADWSELDAKMGVPLGPVVSLYCKDKANVTSILQADKKYGEAAGHEVFQTHLRTETCKMIVGIWIFKEKLDSISLSGNKLSLVLKADVLDMETGSVYSDVYTAVFKDHSI